MSQQPQSFIGGPVYHPAPTPASQTEDPQARYVPRAAATLTVCAEGLVNLNAEASALLINLGEAVCVHAPAPVRAGRRPAPWHISAGVCRPLLKRNDQVRQLRFWLPAAECPPAGRYLLTPVADDRQKFVLVPI